jgi:hypothetical protein
MAVTKITRPIRSTHQLNSEFISLDATPEFHGFAAAVTTQVDNSGTRSGCVCVHG